MSEKNKQIVKDVNDAFSRNSVEDFLGYCADNVIWTIHGDRTVKGRVAIRQWMSEMEGMEPPKFTIDEVVAEGDTVVCRGDMKMKEKDGTTGDYAYCDIYRITNGKIDELNSYVVKKKSEKDDQKAARA